MVREWDHWHDDASDDYKHDVVYEGVHAFGCCFLGNC